jgi:peptidylprolyl isomerase
MRFVSSVCLGTAARLGHLGSQLEAPMRRVKALLSVAWTRSVTPLIAALLATTVLTTAWLGNSLPAWAALPPGNAVTDGYALLRYALPIDSPDLREAQTALELMTNDLRAKRWPGVAKAAQKATRILNMRGDSILAAVPESHRSEATQLLETIKTDLPTLSVAIDAKNREATRSERSQVLRTVGQLEELMVDGFPFEVPDTYKNLPQLRGRATIEFETSRGKLVAIVDGYNAPVTAGNFVDLVQRKFYDGLPFNRSEESYVLQTGDPNGPEVGFIDPKTKKYRAVPLEIRAEGDPAPIYGETFEELGLFTTHPVLPFSSFGTLGMARPGTENNGGSSQFFFFLFEAELTPAGANLIDGRYAAFGYLVEGREILDTLNQTDKIISARVIAGAENLVQPAA